MDILEYQRLLLEHATGLKYGPPRKESTTHTYVRQGIEYNYTVREWIFMTSTDKEVRLNGGANSAHLRNYLINAKGQLTSGQNTTGRPLRRPPKKGYPPSKNCDESWLFAQAPDAPEDMDPKVSGKWMMFIPWDKVDDTWKNISTAVHEGRLARIIHEKCAIKVKPLISFTTMRMGCLMKFFAMKSLAQLFGGLGRFRAVR